MELEKIKEPIGKLIIDSGLGEMTQDGLYLNYTDVITMMRNYAEAENKEVKKLNEQLIGGQKLLLERIDDLHTNEDYKKLEESIEDLLILIDPRLALVDSEIIGKDRGKSIVWKRVVKTAQDSIGKPKN